MARKLSEEESRKLLREIEGWELVVEPSKIVKRYKFPDFSSAVRFALKISEVADAMNHHPDLKISWGKLEVEIWTHSVGGLTEKDFELAKKIDELYAKGN